MKWFQFYFSLILINFAHAYEITMGRILAIDYGKKRVGLAVSDPDKIIANNLTTVPTNSIWDYLHQYFSTEDVETVIIGYPLQMNNTASEAVFFINPFIKKFREKYPYIHLEQVDERFTSRMAQRTMIEGGLKKMARRNKELVDSISATIILQSYMEQLRYKNM